MRLSAVMMAARQPPVTAVAMKMILLTTTKRLAAVLAHFRSTMHANLQRPEGFEYGRLQCSAMAPAPADYRATS